MEENGSGVSFEDQERRNKADDSVKLWDVGVEVRLRSEVRNFEQQYGFMLRKKNTEAIFALRIIF